ncbi:LysR family transcriptional regulator [Stutzerimonas azotifigens]|uniref:LysR family transcriptional regulator n=1 Tax=Stutzerimonas azotifigens TaxID=291995 RepID=UPI0003FD1775|nr:LysR family transcriptional regulator [Stutzerimonas azotifigens]
MTYDLTDLRLFIHVIEAGSITHGAARSHLSTASASVRIKGLEDAVGAPLLVRNARGVRPTVAGQTLSSHARAVLHQLQLMADELAGQASALRAQVRLLANSAALVEHLPAPLADFLAAEPTTDVELEEQPSALIAQALRRGQAELGVLAAHVDTQGLQTRPFRTDRLVAVLPPGHPLAGQSALPFEALLKQPFIALGRGSALQRELLARALDAGAPLRLRATVGDFAAQCLLASRLVGIAVMPESAAGRHASTYRLSCTPLADGWATRALRLCARDFSRLSPAARRLAECLTDSEAGKCRASNE